MSAIDQVNKVCGQAWKARFNLLSEFGDEGVALDSKTGLRVIVTVNGTFADVGIPGTWHHLSASRAMTIPSYLEMMSLKECFFPDLIAISIHPPKSSHINIHRNCLHLWVRADEPAAPDFGKVCGMI